MPLGSAPGFSGRMLRDSKHSSKATGRPARSPLPAGFRKRYSCYSIRIDFAWLWRFRNGAFVAMIITCDSQMTADVVAEQQMGVTVSRSHAIHMEFLRWNLQILLIKYAWCVS